MNLRFPGNYEVPHKALLVPGTTIVMQVDSTIEAPPASSIGVTNSSKTGLPIRLPKAATLSLDGIENQGETSRAELDSIAAPSVQRAVVEVIVRTSAVCLF